MVWSPRDAQRRAHLRRSWWHLLLLPVAWAAGAAAWFALFKVVWAVHVAIYPEHHFADFWRSGISPLPFTLSFTMLFAVAPGALVAGLMIANAIGWLIPPARRAFDDGAARARMNVAKEMRRMLLVGAVLLVGGLAVSVAAACALTRLA